MIFDWEINDWKEPKPAGFGEEAFSGLPLLRAIIKSTFAVLDKLQGLFLTSTVSYCLGLFVSLVQTLSDFPPCFLKYGTKSGVHILLGVSLAFGIKERLLSNPFVLCIFSTHPVTTLPGWLIRFVVIGDFQSSFLCIYTGLSFPFWYLYYWFLSLVVPPTAVSLLNIFLFLFLFYFYLFEKEWERLITRAGWRSKGRRLPTD